MSADPSALAIIPARGGSKRIPRKNVKPFLGQPIIKYSIDAARESGLFDEIMVSSDDAEIRDLGLRLGATAPFARSAAASSDTATTAAVLLEVLDAYREAGRTFDFVCCVYPTAPFVTAARLREAWKLLQETGADSALPVTRFSFPIWRAFKIQAGRVAFQWPENALRRSQDLPPAFHDCGQFYLLRTASFRAHGSLLMPHTVPVMVPESEAQDIDTEEDWKLAELKYAQLAARSTAPVAEKAER